MAKVVRRNVALLAKQLRDPDIMGDYFQQRNLLAKVLSFANQGEDLSVVLPSMVKLLAHPDLCVKKVAGEVLIRHSADNAEMVLLAINTLVQDISDSNPMVRGLALRTLSSLEQDCVSEYLERAVTSGLSDSGAYVRRAAVLACIRLHKMSSSSVRDAGIIDRLYGMIRDSDQIVVVNCLSALEEILKEEGGIVINRNIAHYLLSKLHSYHTWVQIQVLNILKKYHPGGEDELFDILNVLDGCLEHNSPTVVTTVVQLFMGLLENMPHLQTEIYKRAKQSIVGHLGSGNVELTCCLIELITRAPAECVSQFSDSYQAFFCRNKDPQYLKGKKISLLPCLVTEENGSTILEELSLYCVDGSQVVSLQAMRALVSMMGDQNRGCLPPSNNAQMGVFGLREVTSDVSASSTVTSSDHIITDHPSLTESCKNKLTAFCNSSSPHILSNLLQVTQELNIQDDMFWENLIFQICTNHNKISDNEGKAALLYLLGEHGQSSMEAFSVLEDYVENFQEINSRGVKLELLTSVTKMFLKHPAECQNLLGGLFENAVADSDLDVRSRAEFLYSLLEKNIDFAKSVLMNNVS